jgi:hypothetical protein
LLGLVHGKNQYIRPNLLDCFGQVTLVPNFTDNLDVGLVGNGGHYEFPHQAGPICNQHADSFHPVFHGSMWLL